MQFRLRDYFYPLHVFAHHRRMREAPFWSPERLDAWSRPRRKGLIAHAYTHVPYYRRLLDEHGVIPTRVDRDEVWRRIPPLTKDILREHAVDLTATSRFHRGAVWAGTSCIHRLAVAVPAGPARECGGLRAVLARLEQRRPLAAGDRQAALKGLNHPDGWRYHRVIQTLEMSSGRLDPETARLYRDLLERYRPRFLRGYPSSMYLFCRLLRDEGLEAHVPMVISGSEMLHDFQRAMIESVLRTRVYNHYTHWERAASILERGAGRMHAQEDYAHHEILHFTTVSPCRRGCRARLRPRGSTTWPCCWCATARGISRAGRRSGARAGRRSRPSSASKARQNDYLVSQSGALIPSTYAVTAFKGFPEHLHSDHPARFGGRRGTHRQSPGLPGSRGHPQGPRRAAHPSGPRDGRLDIRFCTTDELERNPVGKIRKVVYNRLPPALLERYRIPAVREL